VRWYGGSADRRFLRALSNRVKKPIWTVCSPVNYLTTHHFKTPWFWLFCISGVKIPEKPSMRLHNLPDRPLVMAEIGSWASRRNGEENAASLIGNLQLLVGCAGAFAFVWRWMAARRICYRRLGFWFAYQIANVVRTSFTRGFEGFSGPFQAKIFRKFRSLSAVGNGFSHDSGIVGGSAAKVGVSWRLSSSMMVRQTPKWRLLRQYPVRLISTPNRGLSNA